MWIHPKKSFLVTRKIMMLILALLDLNEIFSCYPHSILKYTVYALN